MIRLFAFFFLCVTSIIASDEILEIPTFSRIALQEIWEEKPSHAMCLVIADLQGSGALVSVDGHICILTAAHLKNPKSVYFMVPDKTAENLKLDSMEFLVTAFFSMQKESHRLTSQCDVQILLVEGNPEHYIKPLILTSEIDATKPICGFGFGTLVAAFYQGRLSMDIPAHYKLDELGRKVLMSQLPAKVDFRNYRLNPTASWVDKLKLGTVVMNQKFNPLISITNINLTTSKRDGVILATTTYDPEKLETHVGSGFSGGPVLQNDKIVGIFQSGDLTATEKITATSHKLEAYKILCMWGIYLAGQKIPILRKAAPFAYDAIISPSIRYMLERFGYTHLSTSSRLCIFNSAVFLALNIYLTVRKAYAHSQVALKGSHKTLFVHMTLETIQWIQSKLEDVGVD
jgi:hypothetical protein